MERRDLSRFRTRFNGGKILATGYPKDVAIVLTRSSGSLTGELRRTGGNRSCEFYLHPSVNGGLYYSDRMFAFGY